MASKRRSATYEAPVWVMAARPAKGLDGGSAAVGSRARGTVVGPAPGVVAGAWGRAVTAMPATKPSATPTLRPSATRRLLLIRTGSVSTAM
jgi:hypothetical protein